MTRRLPDLHAAAVSPENPRPLLGLALAMARVEGEAWLRAVLARHGAAALTALSDEELAGVLESRGAA